MGFCTLPDDNDPSTLLPLEWKSRAAAEAWLNQCYRIWYSWEQKRSRSVPAIPENWRKPKPTPSPWERPGWYDEPVAGRPAYAERLEIAERNQRMREWAKENGYEVHERGPLAGDVREAYAKAHPEDPDMYT